MDHEFKQIEDAILTALEPLKAAHTVRTLEAYQELMNLRDLAEMTSRFPAVYVQSDRLVIQGHNRLDEMRLSVTILVGDRNARGPSSAARGDAGSMGVYAIMMAIRERLHRQRLLPDWTPLICINEDIIDLDLAQGLVLAAARYQLRTPRMSEN